ncbi:MAG TPA: hypothetical protein VFZ87_08850 [Gemmatimonadales bacterium]
MRALFLLLVIAAALAGASYAGARFTAGKVTGPNPRGLGTSTARFAFDGIKGIRAKPRGWIISYPHASGLGRGGAEIYVSPTGRLLGTRPANLAERMHPREAE